MASRSDCQPTLVTKLCQFGKLGPQLQHVARRSWISVPLLPQLATAKMPRFLEAQAKMKMDMANAYGSEKKPPLRIIDLHVDEQHAAEADHHHQKDLKITPRGDIVAREGRSPAVAYYPDVPHNYLTHEDISHAQGSLDIGPIKRRVPISLMRGRTQLNRRDPRAPSYAFRGVPAE
ncbi:hypothetical protein AXG93_583s1000 [Marchantia polymorpha subsp. ruderalis]|uniref:Uncharacterized protein n=1 Tax=Marchantia polymorpha subsp. ruderalis TaxID=1480154 RepID=A0A176VZS9_MARPO|nr:hypothetical protein AXG93_583s1000 [Marchantia polymorpha subsp. ruderalis]